MEVLAFEFSPPLHISLTQLTVVQLFRLLFTFSPYTLKPVREATVAGAKPLTAPSTASGCTSSPGQLENK